MTKLGQFPYKKWARRILIAIFVLLFLRVSFLNYTEPTEVGIARNLLTGRMWAQMHGGWHPKWPWVLVPKIDTRPMKVSVDSSGHGYHAKLVQFIPDEWELFVNTEGWRLWWFSNRVSFNFGYQEEHRGIKDIFRGYAYSPKKYPFLKILQEYEEQE